MAKKAAKKKKAKKPAKKSIWRQSMLTDQERADFLEALDRNKGNLHETLVEFRIARRNWRREYERDHDPEGLRKNQFAYDLSSILLDHGVGIKGYERAEARARYDHKAYRNDLMITLDSVGASEKFAHLFMALDPTNPKDQKTLVRLWNGYVNLQYREQRVETEDTTPRDYAQMSPEQLLNRMSQVAELLQVEQKRIEQARVDHLKLAENTDEKRLIDITATVREKLEAKPEADPPSPEALEADDVA